ncbi:ribonuclease D [Luteimonas cucumeris]|uniref:Ribonuclease D n=1 Tax=Luteimonas cucumeris TaxID=985012 RepID=A0A562L7B0_9GAMM|nr:ribonuclease D [Luteimonas cucumeris]TWI03562.1 ribonuclease D [Luteimonas cucumeris]
MSTWISDPEALSLRIATRPTRIGLDTEFIRERTYWPQLALVQIAIDDEVLLVDSLVPGMCTALAPLLADPTVLKIMHSASEDLIAFQRACNVVPQPLFDTQIAAALAGIAGGIGYQRLVQEQLGVALDKGETRSDWLRRPLSSSQLEYAADDVRHLFALHDLLDARLRELGRNGWLTEDAARLASGSAADASERWPHLAMRAAQYLDAEAQRRLLRLLRWRERQARDSDRPRSWILDNELAVALARMPPADARALQAQLDAHPKAPRKLGAAIWQALSTPLPDEPTMPLASANDRDKTRLKRMQDAVSVRSAELGLPDGVLASRRHLEALLNNGVWPETLSGWRKAQLEPVLAPLLVAGDAASAES